MTPTARTLAHLRKLGWPAAVVETWVPRARVRRDLFGMFDVLAITDEGFLGLQVTDGSNHSKRVAKMRANGNLAAWLAAGGGAEVWSWSLRGAAGKRKVWTLRREPVSAKTEAAGSTVSDDLGAGYPLGQPTAGL